MRRPLRSLAWLGVFLPGGFIAGELARPWAVVGLHNPFWAIWPYAGEAGAIAAAMLWLVLVIAGWLPGLRRMAPRPIRFGPLQALWLLLGFLGMELAGMLGFLLVLGLGRLALRQLPLPDPESAGAAVLATLAGSLCGGAWSLWYIARRGPALLRDATPAGIAWRPAPAAAYGLALLFAALIILTVLALLRYLPPDQARLDTLPDARLFDSPGWPAACILALVVLVSPPIEEFVFRGGVFAALATRYGPMTAGIVSTLAFMAAHAPDKIYYPAGFIDVGLMAAAAAWLRVKFGSIRPGILLHMLYNAGLLVAVGLAG